MGGKGRFVGAWESLLHENERFYFVNMPLVFSLSLDGFMPCEIC